MTKRARAFRSYGLPPTLQQQVLRVCGSIHKRRGIEVGREKELPPKASRQYRVLGEIPWGGEEERPVLRGRSISTDERPAVIRACVEMMQTACAAAAIPKGKRLTAIAPSTPIDPFAFEQGIREFYDRNVWISPLDVMLYASRAVDRLLVELGARKGRRAGGYPTDGALMRERVTEIAADVSEVARPAGIAGV